MNREIKFRAWNNKYKHMFRVREISQNRDGNTHGTIDAEFKDEHTAEFDNPFVWVGRVDFTIASDGRKSGLFQDPDDEPFILMQYTGLHDKNGTPIYEGDVVTITGEQELGAGFNFDWNHKAVVKWDENNCCYYLGVIKKYVARICEDGYFTVDVFELRNWSEDEWWIEYEVVGNIYENPELLEVSE